MTQELEKYGIIFKNTQDAFEQALESNRLSHSRLADNYVHNYMYMGTKDGKDMFKNKNTREYLE